MVMGDFDSAIRVGLAGLIMSLFGFIALLLVAGYSLDKNKRKQKQKSLDDWQNK
jgi:hypothetical protein